ncbi:unnamed protein product [Meloidogyne enterolobii]|uniref:Uncharacterized protein n=1 Tax=Meloidogyne enterolobii TaxID=390850 RepID=A0ACB0Z8Z8_MELEN
MLDSMKAVATQTLSVGTKWFFYFFFYAVYTSACSVGWGSQNFHSFIVKTSI